MQVFIGFHLTKKLIEEGHKVYGIDNLNNYYDVKIKMKRISLLENLDKAKKILFLKNRYFKYKLLVNYTKIKV